MVDLMRGGWFGGGMKATLLALFVGLLMVVLSDLVPTFCTFLSFQKIRCGQPAGQKERNKDK